MIPDTSLIGVMCHVSCVMLMSLKNKRVLITAGPTWVPIDSVRVISNIATGQTGILLAEKLQSLGARVTLLLGGAELCCLDKKIRLIRFRFFDELRRVILKELKEKKYDIVIHSAAVSDYRPLKSYNYKIKSGRKIWRLNLVPTPKIINLIKKVDKALFLVGFKFEPQSSRSALINKARILIRDSKADLVVANTSYNGRYNAYIVSQEGIKGAINSKAKLAEALIREIRLRK